MARLRPAPAAAQAAASTATNGAAATAVAEAPAPAAPAAGEEEEEEESFATEAWIETARCTSCNECTNLNGRLFGYDENKQAFIKDIHAGTFAQLVQGTEKCPAGIIHPGDPRFFVALGPGSQRWPALNSSP